MRLIAHVLLLDMEIKEKQKKEIIFNGRYFESKHFRKLLLTMLVNTIILSIGE